MLRNAKKFRWHALVVILGVYIALRYPIFNTSTKIVQQSKESRKTIEIKSAILKQNSRMIEKYCGESHNSCYTIQDRASLDNAKLVVKRYLLFEDTQEFSVSVAQLKTPEVLTWKNFNTRYWAVDKSVVSSLYAKLMIAMSFIMEALRFESDHWQNVLVIGLGGGVMNNYLSTMDLAMINVTAVELDSTMVKLATTWFDLQQNDSNKVFVGDGIIFVREAKKREEKYGSIMLDACYNEKHPRICPVEEFTRSNVVQDIADILSGDGVLTVNILCSRDALAIENDLLSVFRKHFENCFLLRYNANQRMLVCTHRKKWSFDEQKGRFMDNCRVVDDRFDFRLRDVLSKI